MALLELDFERAPGFRAGVLQVGEAAARGGGDRRGERRERNEENPGHG